MRYYYYEGGTPKGPIELDDLLEMDLSPDTWVAEEGSDSWKALSEVTASPAAETSGPGAPASSGDSPKTSAVPPTSGPSPLPALMAIGGLSILAIFCIGLAVIGAVVATGIGSTTPGPVGPVGPVGVITAGGSPLTPGTPVSSSLGPGDPVLPGRGFHRDFTFEAEAGIPVSISMESTSFDCYLLLLDPSGTVVAQDDDGGSGTDSLINYTPPSGGNYTARATSFAPEMTGPFTLRLTELVTRLESGPLSPNTRIMGRLDPAEDENRDRRIWAEYTFEGVEGETVQAHLATQSPVRLLLDILTPSGELLPDADVVRAGYNGGGEAITTTGIMPESGEYTISISMGEGNPIVNYTLDYTTFMGGGSDLVIGSAVTGTIEPTDLHCPERANNLSDVYTLNLTTPVEIVISYESSAYDCYLILRDSSGMAIARDDDGGNGVNSMIRQHLEPGTYEVVATTYGSGQTGAYTLSVYGEGSTPPAPSVGMAPSLPPASASGAMPGVVPVPVPGAAGVAIQWSTPADLDLMIDGVAAYSTGMGSADVMTGPGSETFNFTGGYATGLHTVGVMNYSTEDVPLLLRVWTADGRPRDIEIVLPGDPSRDNWTALSIDPSAGAIVDINRFD